MKQPYAENEIILLREVSEDDINDIVRWKNDPFVHSMALDYDSEITYDNQQEDIKASLQSNSEMYFIIVLRQKNKSLGYIRINWLDTKKRFAWLRFALGEERGKGYAKQALVLLCKRLFEENCHRVEGETYDFNEASQHVLESIGFKREGVKREAHFDGKQYHDMLVYGLLKNDFKK